jgi:hypothetical protein
MFDFDVFLEPELNRSRSTREEIRNRSTNRQNPTYHHSHSTSSANTRTNKMQTHVLRRLTSIDSAANSNRSTDSPNESQIDRILFDLSSIPTDITNGKYY